MANGSTRPDTPDPNIEIFFTNLCPVNGSYMMLPCLCLRIVFFILPKQESGAHRLVKLSVLYFSLFIVKSLGDLSWTSTYL